MSVTTHTMAMPRRYVQGNTRRVSDLTPLVRFTALRERCASFARVLMPRHLKSIQGWSGKKASECRNTGGAFGDIAVLMWANPEYAQPIADFYMEMATTITRSRCLSLAECVRAEQHAEGVENDAQIEALCNPTRENLLALIEAARAERVRLADMIEAAAQQIAEMDGAR